MTDIRRILKKIVPAILLLSPPSLTTVRAQTDGFPFFRSFLDGNTSQVVFMGPNAGGTADRTNKAHLESGTGLYLTDETSVSQIGAFYLPYHSFSTNEGLLIEFEYMMWGSSDYNAERTDGICIFLVDAAGTYASEANMRYGAEGAGFGYTHRWAYSSSERIMGVRGGYIGIALDNGNFKAIRFEGNEARNGIPFGTVGLSPARNITSWKEEKYNTESNVTIRGAAGRGTLNLGQYANQFATSLSEGFWGYPVLATRHTGWTVDTGTADPGNMRKEANIWLDISTGRFIRDSLASPSFFPAIGEPFNIASHGKFESPHEPAYRKAIIELSPSNDGSGSFMVSVTIQHGNTRTVVIDNFVYPTAVHFMENALIQSRDSYGYVATYKNSPVFLDSSEIPPKLVVGFAASTGFLTPYNNVIKNLRVTTLYGASTANDDIMSHRRGPVTIYPFKNDFAYKKEGTEILSGPEYLDHDSFRFYPDEYTSMGDNAYECNITGQGKWTYDPATQEVVFFPEKGVNNKEVYIYYNIKGKESPYNDEKYRSSLAQISVKISAD